MRNKRPFEDVRKQVVFDALERFPDHGTRTLTAKIYNENKELFRDYEYTRSIVRYYRGQSGDKDRKGLSIKKYVKPLQSTRIVPGTV